MARRRTTPLPRATGRRTATGRRIATRDSGNSRGSRPSRRSSQRRGGSSQSIGAHVRIGEKDDILHPDMTHLNEVEEEQEDVHLSDVREDVACQSVGAHVRIGEKDDILHPNMNHLNEVEEEQEDVHLSDVREDVEDEHSPARDEAQPHTMTATGRRIATRGSGNSRGSRPSRRSSQRRGGSSQSIGAHVRIGEKDEILHPNMTHLNEVEEEQEDVHLSDVREDVASQSVGAHVRIGEKDDVLHPNMTHLNEVEEEQEDVHLSDVREDSEDEHSPARDEAQPHTRIELGVHGNDLFCPDTGKWLVPRLATQLTCAIKARMKMGDAWPSWSHIPDSARELICEDWMSRFDFNEDDRARARLEFYKVGSEKVRSIMYKAREAAKKKCKASGVNHAIQNGRPKFITEANWVALIEYWMKNEWCEKSNKGSVNRKTLVQGSMARHTAGSVSFAVSKKRLAKEKNRPVQFSEVFDKTHSDPRSTAASEAYKEKMKEKYGEDVTAWPYNDDEIYLESMGKPKKGRFYGLGSNTTLVPLSARVGSSSHAAPNFQTPTRTPAPASTSTLASKDKDEMQLMRGEIINLKDKFEAMLDARDVKLMKMFKEVLQYCLT